jgi:hypothetical protein
MSSPKNRKAASPRLYSLRLLAQLGMKNQTLNSILLQ